MVKKQRFVYLNGGVISYYPSKFALVQVRIFSLLFFSLRYFSQLSQPSYSNCSKV